MKSFDAKTIIADEVTTLLGGRIGSFVDGEIIAGDGAAITLQDPATGDALLDCFIVETNEQGPDGFRSLSRWWISPVEKYMIRFDASNSDGKANRAVVTSIKK